MKPYLHSERLNPNLRNRQWLPAFARQFTLHGALWALLATASAAPSGTEFTYQGRLNSDGVAANGTFDFRFAIYDSVSNGQVLGVPRTNSALGVSNGCFTALLDFGSNVFDGNERWLDVAVRTNGGGAFVALSPRQPLTAAPYALYAPNAGAASLATTASSANSVAAANITGALAMPQLPAGLLTNNQAGVTLNGVFGGNGFALTSLNAGNVTAGTLPNARLAADVARTNQVWLLSGNAGASAGSAFVGTTDNQPLEFRVNSTRALRLEPGASNEPNIVAGVVANSVAAGVKGAVIGGGGDSQGGSNRVAAAANYATVGGGHANIAGAAEATVGGGANNTASAAKSVVGGGALKRATQYASTVSGGYNNAAAASYSVIGGGYANTNGGDYSTVSGGIANWAIGESSTIPGGAENAATGSFSLAAGRRAKAFHSGAFVWADALAPVFVSTDTNQFLVRASGGVGINTNNPNGAALNVAGNVRATAFEGVGAGLTGIGSSALAVGAVTSSKLADSAVTAAKIAPGALSHLDASDGSPVNAVVVDAQGLVGIGTNAPHAAMEIVGGASMITPQVLFERRDEFNGCTNLLRACSIASAGSLLAVASGFGEGITIFDISNPQAPVLRSQIRNGEGSFTNLIVFFGQAASLAMKSNLLAVAASEDNTVTLISLANPASPVKVAELRDGVGGWNELGGAWAVAISGNLLAIAARHDNAVTLADISNPAAPLKRVELKDGQFGFTNLAGVEAVALSGNLLAIGAYDDNAVTLVNVANPASPVKAAELRDGVGGYNRLGAVTGLALSNNLLAIAALDQTAAITLVNVASPGSPVKLAELEDGAAGINSLSGVRSLAFSGQWLAASAFDAAAATLFDVSNPANPRMEAVMRDGVAGFNALWCPGGISFAGTNLAITSVEEGAVTLVRFPTAAVAGLVTQQRVGIGTAQPAAPLHVVGNVVVQDADLFDINAKHIEFGRGTATGEYSLALGDRAQASGFMSIAMGPETTASDDFSVALGFRTTASGYGATAMGVDNTASGFYSTALGTDTAARGHSSLAAGRLAQANHEGTFVWSDNAAWEEFTSTADYQFLVRAAGGVGINKNNPATALDVNGTVSSTGLSLAGPGRFNANDLLFRSGTDALHGIGWYGSGKTFAGVNVNGPVLYGNGGGALGAKGGTTNLALSWNGSGTVAIDPGGSNAGNLAPGLTFGTGSGEGIASKRTSGGNQNGLDFYTGFSPRLSIDNSGRVGIGTTSPSDSTLDVRGDIRLNDCKVLLRSGTDRNHGLGWAVLGDWVPSTSGDGAALYGYSGGVLGTTVGGNNWSLLWYNNGNVTVRNSLYQGSDRAIKDHFADVDCGEVLEKVAALPMQTWNYRTDEPGVRHLGPVAQDFHAAFGLGMDDKHIATVDADGVALAAIQGLNQKVEELTRLSQIRREKFVFVKEGVADAPQVGHTSVS